ncbi:hypothetical protein IWQ60_007860 [Tieghemiomyces parasiticus]|uniref:tRNA-splicing endonuclease subunit Sen15 domain-containing protein n=1 Tax=Tieghemiomyces parasiticus TaxID=78921 RepID=A0A9W8DPD7_9FUNG|nr:hypothetical protein IWQ60_007860 [Tieghemiomyces parasiticus]
METHPLYPDVAACCQTYPANTAALFQVYCDLLLERKWPEVKAVGSARLGRAVVLGRSRDAPETQLIVPINATEDLSAGLLDLIHAEALVHGPAAVCTLAIVGDDLTVLYYRVQAGIGV